MIGVMDGGVLDQYLTYLRAAGRCPGTIDKRRRQLLGYAAAVDPSPVMSMSAVVPSGSIISARFSGWVVLTGYSLS
jgi:hypothetical protein